MCRKRRPKLRNLRTNTEPLDTIEPFLSIPLIQVFHKSPILLLPQSFQIQLSLKQTSNRVTFKTDVFLFHEIYHQSQQSVKLILNSNPSSSTICGILHLPRNAALQVSKHPLEFRWTHFLDRKWNVLQSVWEQNDQRSICLEGVEVEVHRQTLHENVE